MEIQNKSGERTVDLVDRFCLAVDEERLYDAEQILEELDRHDAEVAARPVYKTMLMLARGDARAALQGLNESGDAPDELRAICLRVLGDPAWEGLAHALADDASNPKTQKAMRSLLGRKDDFS